MGAIEQSHIGPWPMLSWCSVVVEPVLGIGKNSETLTYTGPNDFCHSVLDLGAVKAGYKVCEQCTTVQTSVGVPH